MGGASHSHSEDSPKKPPYYNNNNNSNNKFKLKILLLVIITNLLTIYIFTSPNSLNLPAYTNHLHLPSLCDNSLLPQLNSTKSQLFTSNTLIADLQKELNSTRLLLEALLIELARQHESPSDKNQLNLRLGDNQEFASVSNEFMLAVGSHSLPLGYSPRSDSDEIYPSVGGACFKYHDDLVQYLSYEVGKECPVDDVFAQKLLLRGCEPLPRRRCHPKSPVGYVDPTPFPDSLWTTPPDTSIIWDPYTCKSYKCLIDRKNAPGFFDCKDCFDLQGREKTRWLSDGGLDYGIDQVLQLKPRGTIRIGLDIGGGSGTFAARMRERNVTIVTTSMNLDGPFNSFIASRGLISMHLSVSQRLPFFENTLDIVHSMHVISNWIPDDMLEFLLYDIYRVLRPGGLFWLDHFFCFGHQLNQTYLPMLDRIGFTKIRWNAGMKLDKGIKKNEWYFSALFEKPMT